ncbi:MAG: macro domain-containing protein [Spirochaetia bacterium]|nr:macro domain-containing protein [Spirochaetia bacterium]
MNTEIIVNTANDHPTVGTGCDFAIYQAAGCKELLRYRKEHIGYVQEGDVFITPAFHLSAKHIIHAVSPYYEDGMHGEEEKLRACYRKSLQLAYEVHAESIAFPLISTGSFGYPKEEGLRIAVDEVNTFLLSHDMLIYLVVFDQKTSKLGSRLYPDLESYIDQKYVEQKRQEEYFGVYDGGNFVPSVDSDSTAVFSDYTQRRRREEPDRRSRNMMPSQASSEPLSPPTAKKKGIFPEFAWKKKDKKPEPEIFQQELKESCTVDTVSFDAAEGDFLDFESLHESKLQERMRHLSDTFSQYLLYLIQSKNMENSEVYKRAIVDKKIFSKIKNNVNYHPQKMTALCLCIGAKLNLDESRDLLARAGYALSPCDKTDVIFSYFIENKIYDMIELDIQLEEHGLPCIIS